MCWALCEIPKGQSHGRHGLVLQKLTAQWETQISKSQKERRLNQAVESWKKLWKLWNIWTGWHPALNTLNSCRNECLRVKGRIQVVHLHSATHIKKTLTTEASTNKMDFAHTTRRGEVSKYQSKNVSTLDSVTFLALPSWLQYDCNCSCLLVYIPAGRRGKGNTCIRKTKTFPNPQQRCLLTVHQPELWALVPWRDSLPGMQFGSGNQ